MKCCSSKCTDPTPPEVTKHFVHWGDRIWHNRCFSADGIPIHPRYKAGGEQAAPEPPTRQPDLFSLPGAK